MIARQIGERGSGQAHSVETELVEAVRGGLHRSVLNPCTRQPRERLCQRNRIRRGQAGTGIEPCGEQAECAETGCGLSPRTPQLAQELHGAGLAVGPGDRDHDTGLAAGETRSKLGETAPRLRILQQRPRRHTRWPLGTSRREHGDGTSRYRIGDEGTAINATARQRREEISGAHAATVRGDAGDFQATRIPPGSGNGTGQSLHGNRAHDFSEPQRRRLRLRAIQRRQSRGTPACSLRGVARGPSGAQARAE